MIMKMTLGNFACSLSSTDFFTVRSGLTFWIQTVCKGYQQTTLGGKELLTLQNKTIELLALYDYQLYFPKSDDPLCNKQLYIPNEMQLNIFFKDISCFMLSVDFIQS